MSKVAKKSKKTGSQMLDEYDFSKGRRGKYHARYSRGSNVVVLDPDVAKVFSNPAVINRSLRSLADIIKLRKKTA